MDLSMGKVPKKVPKKVRNPVDKSEDWFIKIAYDYINTLHPPRQLRSVRRLIHLSLC